MGKQDLSLVSVDELVEELHKRFEVFIFSGMQCRDQSRIFTIRKWAGNSAAAAGLASQIQIAIYDKHIQSECNEADNSSCED